MSKSDVSKKILDFLRQENRPFAFNELFERCGKELGKAAVQKALDSAVKQKLVNVKQKIYYIKQPTNVLEIKKESQLATQQLAKAQGELKRKQHEYAELEPKLRALSSLRNMSSLKEEREKLIKEIEELGEKLQRQQARQKEAKFTAAEAKSVEKRYDEITTAYRKRKRICNDMLDAILEGYPKPKKALIEDIGLETDEEVGFKLNTTL